MKRKLLSLVLAFCMTLSLVPAASAHWVANDEGTKPDAAKFKVEYFKTGEKSAFVTRYFDNEDNDDWGGPDQKPGDHLWDPITVMGDDEALRGCTKAVVTLFENITLEDTTILVAKGHDVTITSEGDTAHTINCTLDGTIKAGDNGAHTPGMDAISIASDNEGNALTLDKVKVAISGPAAAAAAGEGNNPTQGIYNDGTLTLQNGAEVTVNGVSQNGVNGSGTLAVQGTGTKLSVASVGGSGVKGGDVTVSEGAAISVDGAAYHGVTVDTLSVTGANSKVESKNTTMYGVTAANGITLSDNATISATLKDDATVIAPIHLEKGVFEASENATVTGNVFLGSDASISGAGSSKVQTVTAVATIGDKPYATLKDAVAAATSTDTIQLLKDVTLTEKLTINKAITLEGNNKTITGKADDTGVYFEITSGTFTISDAKLTGFGHTAETVTGAGVFKVPDSASDAKIVATNLTVEKFNRAAFDLRSGSFELKDCNINCDNGAEKLLTKGIVAWTGAVKGTVTGGTIIGSNSTYEGWSANGIEISAGSEVTVKDVTINSTKGGISVARNAGTGAAKVTVENCTINAADYALRIFESNNKYEPVQGSSATVTVNGGKYTGDVRISLKDNGTTDGSSTITISEGYFTADPTPYLAEGKAAVESTDASYIFMVKDAGSEAADVVAGEPSVEANLPSDATEKDKELANSLSTAMKNQDSAPTFEGGVSAAANVVADQNTVTAEDGKKALTEGGVTIGQDDNVSIVIQPYMDIEITAADAGEGTFTLDITPMYRTIATTADVDKGEAIKLEKDGKNAVQMGQAKKLNVTRQVTITLPLPTNFVAESVDKLYVNHKKDNGPTYVYTGTVENNVLTFVNPHGFSEFSVSKTSSAVAEVEGVSYASL